MGPLDAFLRSNGGDLDPVDLVEACAGLARAVWYLEDRHSMGGVKGHGRVRCGNVFVAGRSQVGSTFQVKLGDTGLGEPYAEDQVTSH